MTSTQAARSLPFALEARGSSCMDHGVLVEFGYLLDVVGWSRRRGGIHIVPALVEITDAKLQPELLLRDCPAKKPAGSKGNYQGDAVWVRARLPIVFGFAPERIVGDIRPYLLDVGFCAVLEDPRHGFQAIPFACRDSLLWSGLIFSHRGPNARTRRRIARAFWGILNGPPQGLSNFDATNVFWDPDPGNVGCEWRMGYFHGAFYIEEDQSGSSF
jgi:hypothetical protein